MLGVSIIASLACIFCFCIVSSLFLALPSGCTSFYPPHTVECLTTAWMDSGCAVEGWNNPQNMTVVQLDQIEKLNIA